MGPTDSPALRCRSHSWRYVSLLALMTSCRPPSQDADTKPDYVSTIGWIVETTPDLVIAPEDVSLAGQVTFRHAVQRRDGQMVVVDGNSGHLMRFGTDGRFVGMFGPNTGDSQSFGEVSRLVLLRGDSVALYDREKGLFQLDPTGRLIDQVEPFDFPATEIVGRLSSGRLIATRYQSTVPMRPRSFQRPIAVLLGLDDRGRWPDSLGAFPGTQFVRLVDAPLLTLAILPQLLIAVSEQSVYVSTGERFEIERIDVNEQTRRTFARDAMPEILTVDAVLEAVRGTRVGQITTRERLPPIPEGQRVPAISALIVDDEGNLWAAEYTKSVSEEVVWWVVNPTRGFIGSIATPKGLRVVQIGGDFVLGFWGSDIAHRQIHRYRLVRGSSRRSARSPRSDAVPE